MLLLAACVLLFLGGLLAFGPVNIKMDKLRPGETRESVTKKIRNKGYMVMVVSILLILFIVFVVIPMGNNLLN